MLQSVLPADFDILLNAAKRKGKRFFFRKRQVVFLTGSSCDSLYFIEEGLAKVSINSPDGKEAIVLLAGKGSFLGLECLQNNSVKGRESSAAALTNLRAWRIERGSMLELLRDVRPLTQAFVSHLVGVVQQLSERVAEGLLYGSEERLARALLQMEQARGDDPYHLPKGLSQTEMASLIGATRQRVNAVLHQFRTVGVIDTQGTAIRASIQQIISRGETPTTPKPVRRSRKPDVP